MAGSAKPNVPNLGPEISYAIISSHANNGTSAYGLFDGITPNEWNTSRICYWYNSDSYIEINIPLPCNIWRSGTTSWLNSDKPLQIFKYNGSFYEDVTSKYPQTLTPITNLEWEKTISNLSAGQYKFVGRDGESYRIDSEWYLELTSIYFLLQDGNNLCIPDSNSDLIIKDLLPYTKDKFINYGARDLELINPTVINKINSNKYNIGLLR